MDSAIDQNSNATMTARLNTDGITVQRIEIDPSLHALLIDNNITGSDKGGTFAATDSNGRPTMFAVSSADGKTLVALYADSGGKLFINSN